MECSLFVETLLYILDITYCKWSCWDENHSFNQFYSEFLKCNLKLVTNVNKALAQIMAAIFPKELYIQFKSFVFVENGLSLISLYFICSFWMIACNYEHTCRVRKKKCCLSNTSRNQKHIEYSAGYYLKCNYNNGWSTYYMNKGLDCLPWFFDNMENVAQVCFFQIKTCSANEYDSLVWKTLAILVIFVSKRSRKMIKFVGIMTTFLETFGVLLTVLLVIMSTIWLRLSSL